LSVLARYIGAHTETHQQEAYRCEIHVALLFTVAQARRPSPKLREDCTKCMPRRQVQQQGLSCNGKCKQNGKFRFGRDCHKCLCARNLLLWRSIAGFTHRANGQTLSWFGETETGAQPWCAGCLVCQGAGVKSAWAEFGISKPTASSLRHHATSGSHMKAIESFRRGSLTLTKALTPVAAVRATAILAKPSPFVPSRVAQPADPSAATNMGSSFVKPQALLKTVVSM
jgi:hypothetical protein